MPVALLIAEWLIADDMEEVVGKKVRIERWGYLCENALMKTINFGINTQTTLLGLVLGLGHAIAYKTD